MIARGDVMDCLQGNSISTFGGNPLSSTAALATLKYIDQHNLQENALVRGKYIRQRLDDMKSNNSYMAEVRGKGLMQGVELVEADGETPSTSLAAKIMEETKSRGLLIGKGGLHGNCLRIAPPLSVTESECEKAMDILEIACSEAKK